MLPIRYGTVTGGKTHGPVVQLVRTLACHARGRGFEPHPGRHKICGFSSSGRAPPCQGGGSEFEPRNPLHFFRHHSQAVRQRSAKPLFPGSIPGGASKKILLSMRLMISRAHPSFSAKKQGASYSGRKRSELGKEATTQNKNSVSYYSV